MGPDKAVSIPGGADLNNYVTPGWYYQNRNADAASGQHYPANYAGALEVLPWGPQAGPVIQRYTTYRNSAYTHPNVYVRSNYPAFQGWSGWGQVL